MESLSSFVQSPLFSRASIALAGLCALAFFWWRAGSIHSVLDRIWRLIAGKADVHDPVLKALLQESRDIEKFQFIYRLKVETMNEMRELIAWMATHRVGMSKLQTMRKWIDTTSKEMIRQPPKHYVPSHLGLATLAMIVIMGLGPLAGSHDAYLQMRASKVWFKTDAVTVKAPFEGWTFRQDQCASNRSVLAQITGFSQSETEAICDALKNDGLKPLVKQTVEFQAWTGIVGIAIALIFAFTNLGAAISAQAANRLRKKLYTAESKTQDGSTDNHAAPAPAETKSAPSPRRRRSQPPGR